MDSDTAAMGIGWQRWLLLGLGLGGLLAIQAGVIAARQPRPANTAAIHDLHIVDGRWLGTRSQGWGFQLWDLEGLGPNVEFRIPSRGSLQQVVWPTRGTALLDLSPNRAVAWDLLTGEAYWDLRTGRGRVPVGADVAAGTLLVVRERRTLEVVDISADRVTAAFPLYDDWVEPEGAPAKLERVRSYPHGPRVVLKGDDDRVVLADADGPVPLGRYPQVTQVVWSADGAWAGLRSARGISVVDVARQQVAATLEAIPPRHELAGVTAEAVASGDPQGVIIWDWRTGNQRQQVEFAPFYIDLDRQLGRPKQHRQAQYRWHLDIGQPALVTSTRYSEDLALTYLDTMKTRMIRPQRGEKQLGLGRFTFGPDGSLFYAHSTQLEVIAPGQSKRKYVVDPNIPRESGESLLLWIYRVAALVVALIVASGTMGHQRLWREGGRLAEMFATFHSMKAVMVVAIPLLLGWVALTVYMFDHGTGGGMMSPGMASFFLLIGLIGFLTITISISSFGAGLGLALSRLVPMNPADLFICLCMTTFAALILAPLWLGG